MTATAERPSSLSATVSPFSNERPPFPSPLPPGVVVENGLLKSIHGWTWPGIEWGEPPGPRHTYYEYLQSLRDDDLDLFAAIQRRDRAWWHPLTDRGGTGCSLHAAADASALAAVRYLIEVKRVGVNVRARRDGATPLHRAAAVAHQADQGVDDDDGEGAGEEGKSRAMRVFEYLLSKGADPRARARGSGGGAGRERRNGDGDDGNDDREEKERSSSLSVLDFAVEKGHGWKTGEVREMLSAAIERASLVPKAPLEGFGDFCQEERRRRKEKQKRYPPIAGAGASLLRTWRLVAPALPYPPANWRPPPPAGWQGAVGILECRSVGGRGDADADVDVDSSNGVVGGWRPAGSPGDGSCWLRKATKEELDAQAAAAAAVAARGE